MNNRILIFAIGGFLVLAVILVGLVCMGIIAAIAGSR